MEIADEIEDMARRSPSKGRSRSVRVGLLKLRGPAIVDEAQERLNTRALVGCAGRERPVPGEGWRRERLRSCRT